MHLGEMSVKASPTLCMVIILSLVKSLPIFRQMEYSMHLRASFAHSGQSKMTLNKIEISQWKDLKQGGSPGLVVNVGYS